MSGPGAQPGSERAAAIREMFGRIVTRYDRMNHVMTAGQDVRWRRAAARAAQPRGALALDVATGTADLAIELYRLGARRVVGVDFSGPMLAAGRAKLVRQGVDRVDLAAADALTLPFGDGSFDCLTSGFLLRNLVDLPTGLAEMGRVVRPGGRVVALDLTPVRPGPFAGLLDLYFHRAMPWLGGRISGDRYAYRYLAGSLGGFPDVESLAQMFLEAGFVGVSHRRMGFGTVALHLAIR